MRKLLILILCLTIAQCATVLKREADNQEYANSEGESTEKFDGNVVIDETQPEKENMGENDPNNKENPKINYQEQFQNFYYMVPLETEILYPVETMDFPIVYYVK